MKPIIKWCGGKHQLLDKIRDRLPPSFVDQKYYEPFLGGGAVLLDLFELKPTKAIVSDINPELINMYTQVRDNVSKVITELTKLDACHESYSDPKAFYYDVRQDFNKYLGSDTPTQAARFIYLNKHCFNGLYRVNSKGEFNVPFNGKKTGGSFDAEHLIKAAVQLKNTTLLCCDFEDTVKDATIHDFVFFDSPYAPLTPTSFTDYTKEGFKYKDHLRLADLFKELTNRGCYCMLTNHDTPLIRELYKDFNIEVVDVRRSINRNGKDRKGKEVIITNYNPPEETFEPRNTDVHDDTVLDDLRQEIFNSVELPQKFYSKGDM
jgi:DNA adenine methylase